MDDNLLNANKGLARYRLVLHSVLGLTMMICCLHFAAAQKPRSFISNGKKVNIASFNKKVSKMIDEMGIPGLSLAVIENGEVVFANGYGKKRKGEPKDVKWIGGQNISVKHMDLDSDVDRATVFSGASLSKSWLLFVALQLVDEGMLDLDKPLYEYMEFERLAHDDRYKLITPRMVLSHSSGMENWQYQNDEDILEIVRDPGTDFVYSGEGYNYLALVIKQLLNESYAVYAKERVNDRLGLENTYLQYNEVDEDPVPLEKSIPSNFAAGHPLSGGQYLLRNTRVNPAYANHFTAEDYAKLVVALFESDILSPERKRDMLEPKVRMDYSEVFYGPGFQLIFDENDTIISHGGDNGGYKNMMFYSTVKKRGFVMMSNTDWGKTMSSRLNELTAGLDIDKYFNPKYDVAWTVQYPNPMFGLFKIYSEEDSASMYRAFEKLKAKGKIGAKEMNAMATFFNYFGDDSIMLRLLQESKALYPNNAITQALLGDYYLDYDEYQLALGYYNRAVELGFDSWNIQKDIEECRQMLSKTG